MKRKKIVSIIGILCLLCMFLLVLFAASFYGKNYRVSPSEEEKQALDSLIKEKYDGLFLTMFGNEKFDLSDFTIYRAQNMCMPEKDIPNLRELGYFLGKAFDTDPELDQVYLTIDPYEIDSDFYYIAALYQREYLRNLVSYMEQYPNTRFEILLPCYSMERLKTMSAGALEDYFNSIQDMLNVLVTCSNVKVHYMEDEVYFTSNPGVYEEDGTTGSVYQRVQLLFAFRDDNYLLTAGNAKDRFAKIRKQIEERRQVERKDMSGKNIVFFGDSIMANDRNSFTVPGIMASLSNAGCINMALGGSTAGDTKENCNFHWVLDAYLAKDLDHFAQEQRLQKTLNDHLSSGADPDCFVIGFGLNDYFNGFPVDGEGTASYIGSLKDAISELRTAYPQAQILILSPTLCACNKFGEEVLGGNVLYDFVEAAQTVAQEENVEYLDNYHFVAMTEDNYYDYIPDQTHPGDMYKFMLAERILDKLETIILK